MTRYTRTPNVDDLADPDTRLSKRTYGLITEEENPVHDTVFDGAFNEHDEADSDFGFEDDEPTQPMRPLKSPIRPNTWIITHFGNGIPVGCEIRNSAWEAVMALSRFVKGTRAEIRGDTFVKTKGPITAVCVGHYIPKAARGIFLRALVDQPILSTFGSDILP